MGVLDNFHATVYVGLSLDGFIARPDGGIDWLDRLPDDPADGDYGYGEFIVTVDALVMGRNTFDLAMSFEAWPYGELPVFVLTHRAIEVAPATVEAVAGTPHEVAERLAARGIQHVYIDGGQVCRQWLRAGLVQRMVLTRLPVLLGDGIPLFGALEGDLWWRLVSTRTFANGLVQMSYEAEPTVPPAVSES